MDPHDSPKAYQYTPLSTTTCTRVLHLLPGGPDQALQAELVEIDLSDDPHYDALSYCWGEPKFDHSLFIDKRVFYITESLASALSRLRDKNKLLIIWADAVCINQNDIPERNSQVSQMGMIFWQAQEVHVWLGDTTPSDIIGLQHAPRFAAAQAERKRRDNKRHVLQLTPDDFIAYNLPEWQNVSAYSSFMSLGDRWVFSRGWVVQEIALARNLTFHCGNFSLSSDEFFSAVQCCSELGNFTVNDSRAQLWRIIIIRLATVQQENIDLIDLLQLTETFGTQDPRDKIYSCDIQPHRRCPRFSGDSL